MLAAAFLSKADNREKVKAVAKGGIHRDTWKSDLKGIASSKKPEDFEYAHNHRSAPLSALQDPDSFGPPPKHSAAHGTESPTTVAPGTPTLPERSQRVTQASQPNQYHPPSNSTQEPAKSSTPPPPPVPYRKDTTGLRTDNIPKPPVRRVDGTGATASPVSSASPALPARQPQRQQPNLPPQPPRRTQPAPPPPPRQNEYPDEYTPPPPPSYHETVKDSQQNAAFINPGAVSNLSRAGISVPELEIGTNSNPAQQLQQRGPQLSELQQRFARMNTGSETQGYSPPTSPQQTTVSAAIVAVAHKKKPPPPPPPPPKKPTLNGVLNNQMSNSTQPPSASGPPPVPFTSKPRP